MGYLNKRGKIALSFVMVVVILLSVFFLINIKTASSETWQNYFKLESNTEQCLERCEAVFTITNPTSYDIILANNDAKIWYEVANNGKGLKKDIEVYREETTNYNIEILDYGTCYKLVEKQVNMSSCSDIGIGCQDYNIDYCNCSYTCQTGSHQEQETKIEYKPFSFTGKTLKARETWRIKLIGHKKFNGQENNIDWLIDFKGMQPPWAWWNNNWTKCRNITITNAGSTTLTDFPAYIFLDNSSSEFAAAQSDWDDIRFINASCNQDGSELYYDKDNYTTSGGHFYVKIPSLTTSGVNISVYYSNSTAPNGEDEDNTWNDDYVAVYHFSERSGTTASDSSGTGNNGTLSNFDGTQWDSVGKIGGSVDFTDSDDAIATAGNIGITGSQPRTIEWWNKFDTADTNNGLIEWGTAVGTKMFYIAYTPAASKKYYVGIYGTDHGTNVLSTTTWTHHTIIYTGTKLEWWIDGINIKNETVGINTGNSNLKLGESDYSYDGLFGLLDEVRIINDSKNPGWITQTYQMFVNQATYVSIGSEETYDIIPPETSTPIITPTEPKTTDDLKCNTTLNDNKETTLTAYWMWYKNNISFSNGSEQVQNNTDTNITTLSSTNTQKGENWICEIKPHDGNNYGNASNSSSVTIINSEPTQSKPLLTTLSGKNFTTENLTCYNQSTSDPDDGDPVTNIYNWFRNSQSLTVLNIPFEGGSNSTYTKDYSTYGNDGIVSGATWNSAAGKIGGVYDFDGLNDNIKILENFGTSFNSFSAEAWINLKTIETEHRYILERDDIHFYISIMPDKKVRFRHSDLTNGATETEINAIGFNEWEHIVVVYNGTKTYIYVNGDLKKEQEDTGTISFSDTESLYIGSSKYASSYPDRTWNGSIDEVRIYDYALTEEQISAHYNLEYNKIVSQETTAGEIYKCQITPNDGQLDGTTNESNTLQVLWGITFNVTSGEDGSSMNFLDEITCNYTGFDKAGDNYNPYGPYGFPPGKWQCTFIEDSPVEYFDKTITFVADSDKIINVTISIAGGLSYEEHNWLESIYDCLINGNCDAFDLWEATNDTVWNTWERVTKTNRNVVTDETFINDVLNTTHNIIINYTIDIPFKEGYSDGKLLPLRMYFWFHDGSTCYNQDKRTDSNRAEGPFCFPLVAETLGPNNGTVTFTVELSPDITAGTYNEYNVTRAIEIDPILDGVRRWTNYGQEVIGQVIIEESGDATIKLTNTEESYNEWPSITGNVISDTKELFTNNILVVILVLAGMICTTIVLHSKYKYSNKNW